MTPHEIDRLVDRARRAWLRRRDFDGRAPRIADCDVEERLGRTWIVLRDGEDVVAQFIQKRSGEIRYMPHGKY